MYLRTLTNEELLRYVEPVTELEKELVLRLLKGVGDDEEFIKELEREVRYLKQEVQELEETIASYED